MPACHLDGGVLEFFHCLVIMVSISIYLIRLFAIQLVHTRFIASFTIIGYCRPNPNLARKKKEGSPVANVAGSAKGRSLAI
jgi:hypothetical protein